VEWFLAFGGVVCAWALLSAIGSERHKRLGEIKHAAAAEDAKAAPNPPPPRKP
jgi:hypothetical protein